MLVSILALHLNKCREVALLFNETHYKNRKASFHPIKNSPDSKACICRAIIKSTNWTERELCQVSVFALLMCMKMLGMPKPLQPRRLQCALLAVYMGIHSHKATEEGKERVFSRNCVVKGKRANCKGAADMTGCWESVCASQVPDFEAMSSFSLQGSRARARPAFWHVAGSCTTPAGQSRLLKSGA